MILYDYCRHRCRCYVIFKWKIFTSGQPSRKFLFDIFIFSSLSLSLLFFYLRIYLKHSFLFWLKFILFVCPFFIFFLIWKILKNTRNENRVRKNIYNWPLYYHTHTQCFCRIFHICIYTTSWNNLPDDKKNIFYETWNDNDFLSIYSLCLFYLFAKFFIFNLI